MAESSPNGPATVIATAAMSPVPTSSGITPNAPLDPTWSSRMAICGLQFSPNRKSNSGTASRKRRVSNSSDKAIPTVVRIATRELAARSPSRTRSPRTWRARRPSGAAMSEGRVPPRTAATVCAMPGSAAAGPYIDRF